MLLDLAQCKIGTLLCLNELQRQGVQIDQHQTKHLRQLATAIHYIITFTFHTLSSPSSQKLPKFDVREKA